MEKNVLAKIPGVRQNMEKSQLFPDEPWPRRCQGLCKWRQSGRSISCHCPLGCEGVLSTPVLPGTMEAGGMLDVQDSGLEAVGLGLASGLLPVSPLVLQYAHTPVAPHSVWWPPQITGSLNPWFCGVPTGLARLHCLCRLLQPRHAPVVAGEPAALPCPCALRWPLDCKCLLSHGSLPASPWARTPHVS